MTTGFYATGSILTGSNASGPYTGYDNRYERSWSGTDYPKGRQPEYTDLPLRKTRDVSTWAGDKLIVQTIPIRTDAFSRKFPSRHYVEDHPYSTTILDYHDLGFQYRGNPYQGFVPAYLGQASMGLNSGSQSDYGWTASHDYRLLGKLREKVAGSSFNAGVFLGEGKQALKMVADSATRILRGYRAMRHGNFRDAANFLTSGKKKQEAISRKTTSNSWLELQYGWLPLLCDVHDGAQFLAHHLNEPLVHTVVVRQRSNGPLTCTNPAGQYVESYAYREKVITAKLKEVGVYSLAGMMDPLSVQWEIMPYSFIIDWFLPIGDWLSARGLQSSLTGTFVTSTKSVRSFSGLTGKMTAYGMSGFIPSTVSCRQKQVNFTRTVSNSLSIPLPEVVPLNRAYSWRRAANAVALITQLGR